MDRRLLVGIVGGVVAVVGAVFATLGAGDPITTVITVCREPGPGLHPGATGVRVAQVQHCVLIDDAGVDAGLLSASMCTEILRDAGYEVGTFGSGCWALPCPDAGIFSRLCDPDAGTPEDRHIASACSVPNCWTLPDGGWQDSAVVDCRVREPDGGSRYGGCNVGPTASLVGVDCLPSECVLSSGASVDDL